jgi:hypothetical protein
MRFSLQISHDHQWYLRGRFIPWLRARAVVVVFVVSAASLAAKAEQPLALSWSNNLLTVSDSRLPGGKLQIWYLEAFCRSAAWGRDWRQTTLPHKTKLMRADPIGSRLEFETFVEPGIEVRHDIQSRQDELEMNFELKNTGSSSVDLQWFEPACIRVAAFTGCSQSNYTARSFIFTTKGLTCLDRLRRTTNALYLGGQVYLPDFVSASDANPRPICLEHPLNGLIGCFSADGRWLLATASDHTHELFEGVYVCLHSDPRVNGLAPGETKRVRSKIYLLPNDPTALLERYRRDFPDSKKSF